MPKKYKRGDEAEFEIDADMPVFTSGIVCDILHIPIWVLKQLDSEKVVSPKRRKGKSRLYSKNEIVELKHIWHLMSVRRVKVDGIKVILEMEKRGL